MVGFEGQALIAGSQAMLKSAVGADLRGCAGFGKRLPEVGVHGIRSVAERFEA
jgi:hypothetical protein